MGDLVEKTPPSSEAGLFGSSSLPGNSDLVILGVPWDATASCSRGSAKTPCRIRIPSHQLDFFHPDYISSPEHKICLQTAPELLEQLNDFIALIVDRYRKTGYKDKNLLQSIDDGCERMNVWVARQSDYWLKRGKQVGILGGDHSTPLGLIRELAKTSGSFGILHIDAHFDLRESYEHFCYSHASIFSHLIKIPQISKVTAIGQRDFSREEWEKVHIYSQQGRYKVFTDEYLFIQKYQGIPFSEVTENIIQSLPENLYISLDIDGLDPSLCPRTGTPVPGGLQFNEIIYLLKKLKGRRKILGFDLSEVSSSSEWDWDLNVASRLLFFLSLLLLT